MSGKSTHLNPGALEEEVCGLVTSRVVGRNILSRRTRNRPYPWSAWGRQVV